jgi:hypothetical protein
MAIFPSIPIKRPALVLVDSLLPRFKHITEPQTAPKTPLLVHRLPRQIPTDRFGNRLTHSVADLLAQGIESRRGFPL